MSLNHLQYFIFAPKSGLVSDREDVYHAAYRTWRGVWSDVFKEIEHQGELSSDEFIRHDLACVIMSGTGVAAVHLYSYFDLTKPIQLERKYLTENFDEFALKAIQKQGCRKVMTMEYLTVAPSFRGAKAGYAFAEILIALGLRSFLSDPALEGVIACTRNSRKVNAMAEALGFKTVARDRVTHGETADLILFPRGEILKAADFQQHAIDHLWANRIDQRSAEKRKGERDAA